MFQLPATLFCIILILYAFRLDRRESAGLSAALWIPTVWLMILFSRPVSQWLSSGGDITVNAIESGSPLDRSIFTVLILLAFWCLSRRKARWWEVVGNNKALIALYLFAGMSGIWSDHPPVSLKRWLRGVGALAAVLVVATEKDVFKATCAILRRVSILLIPLSVLFIKYYRELGVYYGHWGGMQLVGVTNNKNTLGRLCLVSMLYYTFLIVHGRRQPDAEKNLPLHVYGIYVVMAVWLLVKADSATSLGLTLLGCMIIVAGALRFWSSTRANILVYLGLPTLGLLLLGDESLGFLAGLFGRDPTLTGRTDLWVDLWELRGSMFVGTGYGAFWLGERLEFLWSQSKYWWIPTTAHNGFLEVLLELGIVGVCLLIACIASAYMKVRQVLIVDGEVGGLYLSFFVVFVLYNVTESATSFAATMWFVFMVFSLGGAVVGREFAQGASPECVGSPGSNTCSSDCESHGASRAWGTRRS